jgi:hypothetical protein
MQVRDLHTQTTWQCFKHSVQNMCGCAYGALCWAMFTTGSVLHR